MAYPPPRRPGRFGVGDDDAAVADAAGRQEELLRRLAPLSQVLLQLQRQRPPTKTGREIL